jgi:peroxiredoxin
MKHLFIVFVLAGLLMVPSISRALNAGDKAPLFVAESTHGTISLQSYLGQKQVVLAFYYADFTPV